MKAPKCRSCGKEHWGLCVVEKVSVVKELREKVVHAAPKVVHTEGPVVHKNKHGVYADLEKRRLYRREWMRKRRDNAEES